MNSQKRLITMLVAAAGLLILPLVLQGFGNAWVRIADMALLYVLLALGLNIVVGYAGLLDLGFVGDYPGNDPGAALRRYESAVQGEQVGMQRRLSEAIGCLEFDGFFEHQKY